MSSERVQETTSTEQRAALVLALADDLAYDMENWHGAQLTPENLSMIVSTITAALAYLARYVGEELQADIERRCWVCNQLITRDADVVLRSRHPGGRRHPIHHPWCPTPENGEQDET